MSHHNRTTHRISTSCLLVLAAITGACADANVVGPDTPDQPSFASAPATAAATAWNASGPGTVTVVSDGTSGDAAMSYDLQGPAVWSPQSWEFETTAAQAGTVTLPWSYTGFHAFFQVRVELYAVVNGVVVGTLVNAGPANCCTAPSAGFSYSGTHTFTVNAGDTYGFRFGGQNFDSDTRLNGTFTVDLPEAPAAPATKEDCENGGWTRFGFKNPGECTAFVQKGHGKYKK
jgi:hypothetical protein